MAELVDAHDSKSCIVRCEGSSPSPGTMEDEWLDLVDANDAVIGKKLRSEVHREHLHNYRAINVFIVNSKGELWIPKRTAHKQLFPGGLDFSCAGHVSSGETYEYSLEREMMEELNLDVRTLKMRYLGTSTPADGSPAFTKNYEVRMDDVPSYNPDDFVEYEWLSPAKLIQKIDAGAYAKDALPIIVKQFYDTRA
jgi:isopentenyldiphosphate isomerase